VTAKRDPIDIARNSGTGDLVANLRRPLETSFPGTADIRTARMIDLQLSGVARYPG
jgi:hypothetical protein